jgi:hypothetical protein
MGRAMKSVRVFGWLDIIGDMAGRNITVAILCACCTFVGASAILPAHAQAQLSISSKPDVVISGELASGKTFERDIGHGLIFRLAPSPATFGKGWDIEIVPKDPKGGYGEYCAIATPPYHLYKPTYLNTSYGVTARQAVAMSPRNFQFVESPEDSQAASVAVNSVVYSVDWTSRRDSLAAEAAKISLGTGELKVVSSRITPGKNNEDLGSIDWIKFEVRLWLHSGINLERVLFPDHSQAR